MNNINQVLSLQLLASGHTKIQHCQSALHARFTLKIPTQCLLTFFYSNCNSDTLLGPINCSVKCTCCCSSLDQNMQHTQHTFYSHLIQAQQLQALNAEVRIVIFPDKGFQVYTCAATLPHNQLTWPAVHHTHFYPGPHQLAQSLRTRQNLTAHTQLKHTGRGKSLEVRNSTPRAELLVSTLPCLRLHCRSEKARTPFI